MKYQLVDKETNEIITPHYIGLSPSGQLYSDGMNVTSHYHIRRYTSLKDKYGNDIFEGDILKVTENGVYGGQYYAPVKWIDYADGEKQWAFYGVTCLDAKEVYHNNPRVNTLFTLGFLSRRFGSCIQLSEMTNGDFEIEVVNNIYQNPKLLQE